MGQTITVTTIVNEVPQTVPSLQSSAVISAGASNLIAISSSPDILSLLRMIWNTAIARTMILSVSLVGCSIPFTLGMEWLNAKKIANDRKKESESIEKSDAYLLPVIDHETVVISRRGSSVYSWEQATRSCIDNIAQNTTLQNGNVLSATETESNS